MHNIQAPSKPQSKIQKFKKNKRAFYSLIIFTIILFFTLIVELYSNNKPILVKYNDAYYFPIIKLILKLLLEGILKLKLII